MGRRSLYTDSRRRPACESRLNSRRTTLCVGLRDAGIAGMAAACGKEIEHGEQDDGIGRAPP